MKDPAVLFFISDWLTATAEMDADTKGWYLDLILHNYDKGSLPNDIEKLAKLAGVKFSEYERFKQVFEQLLKQKFDILENGRLSNEKTSKILQAREIFKDKRSQAGKISYLMRFFAKNFTKEYKNEKIKSYIKDNFDYSLDLTNEQMIEQVFKQMFELYRNENRNEDVIINDNIITDIFTFEEFWTLYPNKVAKAKCKEKYQKLALEEKQKIFLTLDKFTKWKPFENYNHPNPETYINQKRWDDVLTPSKIEPPKYDMSKDKNLTRTF